MLAMVFCMGTVIGQQAAALVPEEASGAVARVEALHQALLKGMRQTEALGFVGRRQLLAPVVADGFDFETISAAVLGASQWQRLTRAQRTKMEETFRELTLTTYANRFAGYAGEEFKTISHRPLRQGRMLVRSELRVPDEPPVRFDYVLHRVGDQWRIVNILADGVSDLSVKRAEYSSILRRQGFEQLISKLEKQVAELSTD